MTPIILLAEDDEEDRMMLEDASRQAGISVPIRCVENGEDLLDFLHQRNNYSDPALFPKPLIILLDLNMPKLDGRQALDEIKKSEHLRKIPIIVFTTSSAREEIHRAYAAGASSFIIKPFSFNALVDMMKIIKHYWMEMVELP